jgi:pyruvate kinase
MKELSDAPLKFDRTRTRRTRIICSIGPASRSPHKLAALIQAGMDIARLHSSYSDQAENAENIKRLRDASQVARKHVSILQDLAGSKVRMSDFSPRGARLREGQEFTLSAHEIRGSSKGVAINFPELIRVVERGDTVLLADGALELKVRSRSRTTLRCEVIRGGKVKSNQAVHVPGKAAPIRVPTPQDRDDVRFGVRQGVDWIAQSYATSPEEIEDLRQFIRSRGAKTPIIVKIERRAALQHLDALIAAADAVMVARGDLGMEIPLEQIALVQKDIVHRANAARKPVIVATEMLFSMVTSPTPTRAEVADITNAILDGADAVMLSGETGIGQYPVEAVSTMARITKVADAFLVDHLGKSALSKLL